MSNLCYVRFGDITKQQEGEKCMNEYLKNTKLSINEAVTLIRDGNEETIKMIDEDLAVKARAFYHLGNLEHLTPALLLMTDDEKKSYLQRVREAAIFGARKGWNPSDTLKNVYLQFGISSDEIFEELLRETINGGFYNASLDIVCNIGRNLTEPELVEIFNHNNEKTFACSMLEKLNGETREICARRYLRKFPAIECFFDAEYYIQVLNYLPEPERTKAYYCAYYSTSVFSRVSNDYNSRFPYRTRSTILERIREYISTSVPKDVQDAVDLLYKIGRYGEGEKIIEEYFAQKLR